MDTTSAVKIGAAGLALSAAGISLAVYAKDRSATFFSGKSERVSAVKGARGTILLTQYGVVALVAASLTVDSPWLLLAYNSNAATIAAGVATGAVGLLVFLKAEQALGHNYTPCFNAFMPLGVTTWGSYSKIRHPIYAANLLLVLAAFIMSGSLYIVGIFLLLARLYSKSARREEEALSMKFPAYMEYMRRTGRFVPKLF